MTTNWELIEAVEQKLSRLDGTTLMAVALITGFSFDEINELGGIPEEGA